MAEETSIRTEQETTPVKPIANGTPDERMVPSYRLQQEITAKREAVEMTDSHAKTIANLKSELAEATAQISSVRDSHTMDMHLIRIGFKHDSVMRFFKKEYREAVADVLADNRPPFDAWLEANKDDPLYSVHFKRTTETQEDVQQETTAGTPQENQLQALLAALAGNPNVGTGQPAENRAKEWSVEELRKLRAKNGGTLGVHADEIKAQWRAKGLIK